MINMPSHNRKRKINMEAKRFLIINLALIFTLISFNSSASNIEDSDWYSVYKNEFGELKSRYNYPNHFTFHNNGKSLMIVQNINDISIRFLDDSSSRKIFFNTESSEINHNQFITRTHYHQVAVCH